MSRFRPRTRFFGLLLALLVLPSAAPATPIEPDVKKLILQPDPPPAHFVPARAGWNGPEAVPPLIVRNPALEKLRSSPTAGMLQATLLSALLPDLRTVAAMTFLILVLRRVHQARLDREARQLPATVVAIDSRRHVAPGSANLEAA